MAGRRTNLALLGLLAAAVLTGFGAFAAGTAAGRWVIVAHGLAGIGLVALSPWKSVIARRGLRRRRPGRWPSVTLAVLLVVAVASGFVHAAGLRTLPFGLTVMQVHVGAALAALPFAAAHVRSRPARVRRTDLNRRNALRAGLLVGGAGLAWLGLEGLWRAAGLPGARRRFTGSHALPRPLVTQWLFDPVPRVDADRWRLRVEARLWSLEELDRFGDTVSAVLDCTGGWYAPTTWRGARLDQLLGEPGDARSIVVRSVTGYTRVFPAGDAGTLLLATAMAGEPLSPGHGFPARLVAPGRRGFWWVKWVNAVEWSPRPWWAQPPFPLQ